MQKRAKKNGVSISSYIELLATGSACARPDGIFETKIKKKNPSAWTEGNLEDWVNKVFYVDSINIVFSEFYSEKRGSHFIKKTGEPMKTERMKIEALKVIDENDKTIIIILDENIIGNVIIGDAYWQDDGGVTYKFDNNEYHFSKEHNKILSRISCLKRVRFLWIPLIPTE